MYVFIFVTTLAAYSGNPHNAAFYGEIIQNNFVTLHKADIFQQYVS